MSNYPDAVPTVAEWHFSEWGHTDPGGSLAAWTAGMARQASADQIPGTLVAVHGQTLVGVVCLVERDMAATLMRASLPLAEPARPAAANA